MVGVGLAFALSAILCLLAIRVGPALGYVDRPDDPTLKAHTAAAVPLGGVAVFFAFHAGSAVVGEFRWGLFLSSLLLGVLGLMDDRAGLSPVARLGVELVAGAILGADVAQERGWAVGVLVAGFVVVAVNAVNLFDGLDGLAATAAIVTLLAAAILATIFDASPFPSLVLAGALIGFLLTNWHPAKVFLGDNGSYTLAVFLVAILAAATEPAEAARPLPLLLGMGLLGIFLVDLASTVLRRIRSGSQLFLGDRNHIYDRLHAGGFSVPAVASIIGAIQLVLAGVPVILAATTSVGWSVAGAASVGTGLVLLLGLGQWLPETPPSSAK